MRKIVGVLALILLPPELALGGAPVTMAQLLSMAREKVDPKVILALVERDCVAFEVDASNAAELSHEVSTEVLEAAIRCRRESRSAEPVPEPRPSQAPPAVPSAADPGRLRVRADFIGESGALTCECWVDGAPFAVLTKLEQGEFGQAVPRDRIRKESAFVPVSAGSHRLRFRCDPKAQEVTRTLEIKAGEKVTVEIRETMFRRWKVTNGE
jgi:hypothetical protein